MTDSWPPRWTGSQFKQPRSLKVGRVLKREKRDAKEKSRKDDVRKRDKYCRFPLCGCKRFGLALREVSHSKHKGMGGNPKGDRSEADLMVLVCAARHKENIFSIDRKTIRWRPLTSKGADGPIAWDIKVAELRRLNPDSAALMLMAVRELHRAEWLELVRETAIHIYEPLTPFQRSTLERLKGMEL